MSSGRGLTEGLAAALADRYTIEAEIDSGGMATVYRARDLKHERTVAIKVLRPDLVEAVGADRFLREIRTTANLSHPHILPLFDSGEAAGFLFYVMPFVKGESLRDRLEREGQLPLEDAVQIAREVADALAYAHKNGVIHRDIKPANIMLDEGHALLADFGIAQAKAGAESTKLTGSGMSLGTPAYMSPEQISGEGAVDGRSDQYALACVLYEMLAGHPPFTGADIQTVMRQHLAADAPRVTGARASVPAGVAKALHRALAKSAADRFRTVAEFEKALAGATLPLLARVPMGRARAVVYGVAVILGLATAAVIASVWPTSEVGSKLELDPDFVVVAPFDNLTQDEDLGYVGLYAADELRRAVKDGFIDVEVLPMGMARRVLSGADEGVDRVQALSAATGAGTALIGRYYQTGDSIRITVECIDARTGEELFSVLQVPGLAEDPTEAVQNTVRQVAVGLAQYLGQEYAFRNVDRPPANLEALKEHMQGQEIWGSVGVTRTYPEAIRDATPHFHRASELDSTYMAPLVEAFVAYMDAGRAQEADSIIAILDRSRSLLTPYQRHQVDALRYAYLTLDPERSLDAARQMAEIAPLESAYVLGVAAVFANHPEEGVEAFRLWRLGEGGYREAFVSVFGWWYFEYCTEALHLSGRYQEELEAAQEGRRRFPEGGIGNILAQSEARARIGMGELEEVFPIVDGFRETGARGYILNTVSELSFHGLDDAARRILEDELAGLAHDSLSPAEIQYTGDILHRLGRNEEAQAVFRGIVERNPEGLRALGKLGVAAALAGDLDLAREMERRIDQHPQADARSGEWLLAKAEMAAALGEKGQAVVLLEEYSRTSTNFPPHIILHRSFTLPHLLKDYPPFQEFMRPKG